MQAGCSARMSSDYSDLGKNQLVADDIEQMLPA